MGYSSREKYFIVLLVLGTVIIVPFVYLPIWSVNDFFYFPKYIALVLITSLLLIIIIRKPNKIKDLIKLDLINQLLFIYFILLTISLFFSLDPLLSIQGNFLRYDGYTTQLMYIILFLFARTIQYIDKKFIYAVSVSSAVLSILGILQYLGLDPFIRDLTRMRWTSAFSTFGNQNFFGSYLVLQIPFSLYIVSVYKERWAYIPYGLSFLVLLMTMTRSAWIGFSISFVYISYFLLRRNESLKIILIFSVLILIIFNLIDNNLLLNRFFILVDDIKVFANSVNNKKVIDQLGSFRMFIWVRALYLIKLRPFFGFGIENVGLAFEKYFYKDIIDIMGSYAVIDKIHNDFLHIAVTTGIPSLLSYFSFLISIAIQAIKKFKYDIYILFFASILGYLTCLFFNISVVSVAYIFWIYLGLICKYNYNNDFKK